MVIAPLEVGMMYRLKVYCLVGRLGYDWWMMHLELHLIRYQTDWLLHLDSG